MVSYECQFGVQEGSTFHHLSSRFIGLRLKSVIFEDSFFEECYFEDVTSTNTFFRNCTFVNTVFYNTGKVGCLVSVGPKVGSGKMGEGIYLISSLWVLLDLDLGDLLAASWESRNGMETFCCENWNRW